MPEWGPLGSVRGALSNERPYRDLRNVVANYPIERSHRFAEIQPNLGHRDYSRAAALGDTQLVLDLSRRLARAVRHRGAPLERGNFPKYIRAPMQEMPGTRMAFVGIKNDKDIADLWAYLKQFGTDGAKK